jgi:hypothetical protein
LAYTDEVGQQATWQLFCNPKSENGKNVMSKL